MEKPFTLNFLGIGDDVRQARQALKLSVAALASRTGIAGSHIWNIEQGRSEMSVEKFFTLCAHVGLAAADVLDRNIRVSQSYFRKAAERSVAAWANGDGALASAMLDYVAGCSSLVVYVLIFPTILKLDVGSTHYYTREIRNAFTTLRFRNSWGLSVLGRGEVVERIVVNPADTLSKLGLITEELFSGFIAERTRRINAGEDHEWVIQREKVPLEVVGEPLKTLDPASFGRAMPSTVEAKAHPHDAADKIQKESLLDNSFALANSADDMAVLDNWIERLRKVCRKRGAMSRAAEAAKVSRQAVAQWLLDDPKLRTRPSGDAVLPLIEWVQAEEAQQQKSPAEGATSTERKAQRKDHGNGHKTSGRKKV